jgi:hypothetical protein
MLARDDARNSQMPTTRGKQFEHLACLALGIRGDYIIEYKHDSFEIGGLLILAFIESSHFVHELLNPGLIIFQKDV